jgi:uncharacterized protein
MFEFTHRFDAPRFANAVKTAKGTLGTAQLRRVAQSRERVDLFAVSLDGFVDADHGPTFTLKVHGTLGLRCERCLRAFDYSVDATSELIVAKTDVEAQRIAQYVDEKYDVLVASEIDSALQLFEDEILLAVPFSPRCSDDCQL